MRLLFLLTFIVLACFSTCEARDMIVGSSYNTRLVWQEKANYMAFPLKKRVKEVFWSNPSQQIIRGVIAKDLDHSRGSAAITAGGVGSHFVNVRLKSGRGHRLNYQIEIYV